MVNVFVMMRLFSKLLMVLDWRVKIEVWELVRMIGLLRLESMNDRVEVV